MAEPATSEHFEAHLKGGDYILGIIMLRENNSCNFGVIDIDIRGDVKLKESQENIKKIRVEGVSGSNSVKVILDGEGEMQKIEISNEMLSEEKSIIEDLIVAAHNDAKTKLKSKTTEEISKATGGFGIPGFKWPI